MDINLRSLIAKLNETTRRALEAAAGACLSRSNYNVEIEHWFLKLCEDQQGDFVAAFAAYDINRAALETQLTRTLDLLKTGNTRPPSLSVRLVDLIREAWVLASIEYGVGEIRSGHVLLALLLNTDLNRWMSESCKELKRIGVDDLKLRLMEIVEQSHERPRSVAATSASNETPVATSTAILDQFTINLTERAQQGLIDPVLGRDAEIRQMVDILIRRRQNNPILTGEAGVGKTAVVEGLALRIAAGDVPEPLKPVIIRTLDLGLLQAGAGVKGEFENRLKGVLQEVKASPRPIILFIDEAHTMIGAGGQAGQSDAANLLKPALARGELRTIAATTWSEYKKYFEKDAALARRFQVIKVEEPQEQQACDMLRGLCSTLEKHHGLRIIDEAVDAAVKLSSRYLSGRQLPDKAVSLLDTAAARVSMSLAAVPALVEDARRTVEVLTRQLEILEREHAAGHEHSDRLSQLTTDRQAAEARVAELEERWKQELELVRQFNAVTEKLEQAARPTASTSDSDAGAPASPAPDSEPLKAERRAVAESLQTLQGDRPLVFPCVNAATIAEVVSAWTGIPVGRMVADELKLVTALADRMKSRVIGQPHALAALARRIQTSRARLTDPRRPVGVFLLVGPSGVGKTETALTLAELLYGGERNLISINMSEYQEAHTVSGLKGAPPGYVGYGEGGVLTEAVRRKPYSVVLLDEVEKAHSDVLELFYQVFDKGVLEDGEGREIDFKNTIILLTSNVASHLIQSVCADVDTCPEPEKLAELIRPDLLKVFKPALLGRMAVLPYYPLADDVMKSIVELQLTRVHQRLRENHGAEFHYDPEVIVQILARCRESETGARNVDHIITGTLLPELSREILSRMGENMPTRRISCGLDASGQFAFHFE